MSFNGFQKQISEDDTVILYLTVTQVYSICTSRKTLDIKGELVENVFQTPYGALKCADLIGAMYGSKITLDKGKVYLLQPTPELWAVTLPHRTQIIYTPDISMIIVQLELTTNSIVIESGTGSGCLSHALIRTIKPHGHLYTFDFHEERANAANKEFESHGYKDFVTVQHEDVCTNGFGDALNNKADAVFLDMPHPWLAIPHAAKSIKEDGGRICSFSPCIEQVQKSCLSLTELGFQEIETMEVLQTQYSVQVRHLNVLNLNVHKTARDGNVMLQEKETMKTLTAIPPVKQPGHTGFLTFATFPPVWARLVDVTDEIK